MINPNRIYPTPDMSPSKTKITKKGKTSKKKSVRYDKKANKLLKKNLRRWRKNGYRGVINVKNDNEFYNKIVRRQKLTKTQRRKVRNRFRNGYSPFEINNINQIQITKNVANNHYKYIWRTCGGLKLLDTMFKKYPYAPNASGSTLDNGLGYIKSQEQSIYISEIKFEYDILNPTDYDMSLDIYDIVYKDDTYQVNESSYYEDNDNKTNAGQDPINLFYSGQYSIQKSSGSVIGYGYVADPMQIAFDDIGSKPTDSYPFNIYCKIHKKQTFRLQPGATMKHVFKWKPRSLINLGYLYKYRDYLLADNLVDIALKNITCGSMFRIIGQISGTGSDANRNQVANCIAKLALKENLKIKYYCMDQKFNYIFKNDNSWTPNAVEMNQMEVVTNMNVRPVQEINLVNTDNTTSSVQT